MADQPSKKSLEQEVELWTEACRNAEDEVEALRQQNAALVSALRELEQKWRTEGQRIREQIEKGKSSGCIMIGTVIEWEEEADKLDAHADELKTILAPYAPAEAEAKEKP